ncbi:nucleotidyltransferase [Legionella gratiana]|uniref:Nucleotidyltransferase n=1 Tax=Legionella gratiana TaxID=45066 RepID=A0A378JD03_9GAMM|nr:malonate decarboxylase holo-[acyl-carrier-protein] synthase [Legionella gratiana]KTD09023.1 nucleotidyltransferase [Legionella gratiana]STX45764.1 nucleotidyltransferase [Legionella gratiana]
MTPQRHHLIYLKPDADFSLVACHGDKKIIEEQVSSWLTRGFPCIYAKQLPDAETVNLGLSLWYASKKHRVGLRVVPSVIQKQEPLPQLIEMQDFFLRYYGLDDLSRFIEFYEMSDVAVYGSFLFQYLSGYDFVTESSDLDLLLNYDEYSLAHLQGFIDTLTQQFKRTIDGEVRFQTLGDISIKELLNTSTKKLLCKSKNNVILLSRTELYEHYPLL